MALSHYGLVNISQAFAHDFVPNQLGQ
ncbi:protein of unknown function [Acidithiobacillus ferrivorans]|uniref:Uncharacterized protein n=1 Tax=Acidithiobacillus ferrivorans TaxID=160808 RepID=A0ABY1MM97_9PROT|nr:protein of unknown function [Acidithiobacillus ferrivorans]